MGKNKSGSNEKKGSASKGAPAEQSESKVWSILRPQGDPAERRRGRAMEALEKIQGGQRFDKVAQEYSEDKAKGAYYVFPARV
ncbi:hypothetical protein ID866_3648 [Astraeus odoratus]|nr:hypothetical protein ID866_3648 [Astraeus odoratus]